MSPRPQIDGLTSARGLAAWFVVVFHFLSPFEGTLAPGVMSVLRKGYLAVDLFFVLSGFVIYLNYGQRLASTTAAGYGRFLLVRLGRIYPLHAVVLALFLLNAAALAWKGTPDPQQFGAGGFLASVLLVQNWGVLDRLVWNIPAWSISVEWFAYLVFPLLVWAVRRWPTGWWALVAASAALALALGGIFIAAGQTSIGGDIPHLGVVRCVLQFAVGCVIARSFMAGELREVPLVWPVLGLAAALAAAWSGLHSAISMPFAFAMTVVLLLRPGAAWMGWAPLVWVGEISYSTYMIHMWVRDWVKFLSPTLGVLQFVVYIVATLGVSALLYRWVEVPAREWVRARVSLTSRAA